MATRTLTVNLVGRTDKLNRSFKNASRGADTMAGKMMKATRMAGIGFTALGGVAVGAAMALKPMIDQAASLEESLSKNRLMFGESSKAVEAFAETSLHSFGVTERAALEATGVFGNLGKAMEMSEAESASMATTLTGLAGDMSSLHDVRVEDALTALRAGLIGEAEPLRRFGILLDAASIKAKALELGLLKTTKEAVTPAIKSQAAYALILEKGEIAMGDFERTSDSATNKQKILAGEIDRVSTSIGEALLPAFTKLVGFITDDVIPTVEGFGELVKERGVLEGSAEALGEMWAGGVKEGAGVELKDWAEDDAWWDQMSVTWLIGKGVQFTEAFLEGAGLADKIQKNLDEAIRDLRLNALAAVIQNELGRLNPDWDRGEWEAAGRAAFEVFYGTPGPTIPAPGLPPDRPVLPPAGPMIPGPLIPPGPVAPVLPPAGPMVPGPGFPTPPGPVVPVLPPAGPMVPGPGFPTPRVPALPGRGGFTMDPGQRGGTTVIVNATAVTGQEVVDAIGAHVDLNGPLPPHWQQGAN